MPLTKAKALSITDVTTLTYAGEQVRVEYYPLRVLGMTVERAEALQRDLEATAAAAAESGDPAALYALVGAIWSTYVAGWDVTDGEGDDGIGAPIALTDGAALFELDPRFDLFAAIMAACREAAMQAKPAGTTPPQDSDGTTALAVRTPTSHPSATSSRTSS